MDWNDNDPFESIVRDFFGESPQRRKRNENFHENEEEDRVIDFIESDDSIFLIFELSGYIQKDVKISLKENRLEVKAQKLSEINTQEYLGQRLKKGITFKKTLPENILLKSMKQTVKNGIVEIRFDKND